VKVMHREFFKDELLGIATVHLKDFVDGNAHAMWIPLMQVCLLGLFCFVCVWFGFVVEKKMSYWVL
jgi:hypothetical protein